MKGIEMNLGLKQPIVTTEDREGRILGVIDNVQLGTGYCYICAKPEEMDMVVGCVDLETNWQLVCRSCLAEFAPELLKQLEKALDERYQARFGKSYEEVCSADFDTEGGQNDI